MPLAQRERPVRPRLGHRRALDGIRGIAVLMVLLGHLGIQRVAPAGTVGVSLFFVLSGFLITMLLLEEHEQRGSVRLGRFYARRALRLFPALVVLLVVVGAYAAATGDIDAPIGYTALYAANLAAMRGVDLGVLGHTWSLALEEQFYLVWPAVLVLLWRRPRWAPVVVVAGIVASLAANVVVLRSHGEAGTWERVTFGPDTRSYALFVGCLVAILLPTLLRSRVLARAVLPAAAVVVVASAIGDRSPAYTLVALPLVAIAGAVLIVSGFKGSNALLRHIGGSRLLTGIGRISYGLYLWHIPVFVVLGPPLQGAPFVVRAALRVVVSLAVAAASYHLVERPFLDLKDRRTGGGAALARWEWPGSLRLLAAAVVVVLGAGIGAAVVRSDALPMTPSQAVADGSAADSGRGAG